MDTFIITGANAEPALSVARRLCEMGARVYGIAGTFPEVDFAFNEFFPVACDITNPRMLAEEIQRITECEKTISGLIFSTPYFSSDAFETLPPEEIPLAVNALVLAPLLITRLVLPSLVASRGSVIAVSQNTVTPRGHVLNNLADATMKVFTGTLFAELRDTGVKTCHIFLQNNTGTPDPAAQFTPAPQSKIQPDIVAEAVETVLRLRENNALTQIVLRPQSTRETPHIPVSSEPRIRTLQVVRLPESKNYPPREEAILTPKYRRPDYAPPRGQKALEAAEEAALEAEEFADDYVDPELRYLVKEKALKQNRAEKPENVPAESVDMSSENQLILDENGNPIRRKRKRRRKKKNRNGAMLIQPPQIGKQGEKDPVSERAVISEVAEGKNPDSEKPILEERELPLETRVEEKPERISSEAEVKKSPKVSRKKKAGSPLTKSEKSSKKGSEPDAPKKVKSPRKPRTSSKKKIDEESPVEN